MHMSNVEHVLGYQNDNHARHKSVYFASLLSLKDTHSYVLQANPIFIAARQGCSNNVSYYLHSQKLFAVYQCAQLKALKRSIN
jgi:hypothetical protein